MNNDDAHKATLKNKLAAFEQAAKKEEPVVMKKTCARLPMPRCRCAWLPRACSPARVPASRACARRRHSRATPHGRDRWKSAGHGHWNHKTQIAGGIAPKKTFADLP